jgi:hypothetical protein
MSIVSRIERENSLDWFIGWYNVPVGGGRGVFRMLPGRARSLKDAIALANRGNRGAPLDPYRFRPRFFVLHRSEIREHLA